MKRTLPWAAVALACLLSGAARSAEVPDEVREYVESRLPDLNAFVRVVTGYQATHLPRVEYRTPHELHLLAFGERGADAYAQCVETANVCVRAVAHGGVIFLSTAFKADGDDDDVLVHELVHFQQFEAGRQYDCVAAAEPEAYAVQDMFVDATGRGTKSDPLFVTLITSACYGYPYR